jgi:hypothetical protein
VAKVNGISTTTYFRGQQPIRYIVVVVVQILTVVNIVMGDWESCNQISRWLADMCGSSGFIPKKGAEKSRSPLVGVISMTDSFGCLVSSAGCNPFFF